MSEQNLVMCRKPDAEEAAKLQAESMHDATIVEMIRVRTLVECFDIISEACTAAGSENAALRRSAISVISTLAASIARLDLATFEWVEIGMMQIRQWYQKLDDQSELYSELIFGLVALKRKHAQSIKLGGFRTSQQVFDYLWTLHHELHHELDMKELLRPQLIQIARSLGPSVLDIVRQAKRTRVGRDEARRRFNDEFQMVDAARVVRVGSGHVIDLIDVQLRMQRAWHKACRLAKLAPNVVKKKSRAQHTLGRLMSAEEEARFQANHPIGK